MTALRKLPVLGQVQDKSGPEAQMESVFKHLQDNLLLQSWSSSGHPRRIASQKCSSREVGAKVQ